MPDCKVFIMCKKSFLPLMLIETNHVCQKIGIKGILLIGLSQTGNFAGQVYSENLIIQLALSPFNWNTPINIFKFEFMDSLCWIVI